MSLFKILPHLLPVGSVENHENFIQGTRSPDSSLKEGPPVQDVGKLTTCVCECACVCVCVCVCSTNRKMLNVFDPSSSSSKKTLQLCTFLRQMFNTEVQSRFLINGCTICSVLLQPASSANARVILTDRTKPSTPNTVVL